MATNPSSALATPPPGKLPLWKNLLFGISAVALALLVVEMGVRLAGAGKPEKMPEISMGMSPLSNWWLSDPADPAFAMINPNRHPWMTPQRLKWEKGPGVFRVLFVGGSTVARSFRLAEFEKHLQRLWPDLQIEVINGGGLGFASDRDRLVLADSFRLRPDLVVIYSGHNEFEERRFCRRVFYHSPATDWLREAFSHVHTFQLFRRLWFGTHAILRTTDEAAEQEVIAALVDPRLGLYPAAPWNWELSRTIMGEIFAKYEENLRLMVRFCREAGVPVLLGTVASNIVAVPAQANLEALPRENYFTAREVLDFLSNAASSLDWPTLEQASAMVEKAPLFAPALYIEGRILLEHGALDEARKALYTAIDLDYNPHRATRGTNRIVRRVARELGVPLAEVERDFLYNLESGVPDYAYFADHCHVNFAGAWRALNLLFLKAQAAGLLPRPYRLAGEEPNGVGGKREWPGPPAAREPLPEELLQQVENLPDPGFPPALANYLLEHPGLAAQATTPE